MLLQRIFFSIFSIFVFLFLATTSAFAAFTIGDIPATVDENGELPVGVNLSITGQAGSSYYLRAAFSHSTTPTSYFGYTKNNVGNWYNGTPSPIDRTQFYKVTLDSNATWRGTIQVKPDPLSTNYKGAGPYKFKVGRYTEAGSLTWSDNEVDITITKTQSITLAWGNSVIGLTIDKGSSYFVQDFLKDLNESFVPANIPNKTQPQGNKVLSITHWDKNRGRFISNTSENFPVVLGEGYFVRTNWQGTSTLVGIISSLLSIDVSKGWSMISFPRALTGITDSSQLLSSLQPGIDVRQIARWYGGRWQTYMEGGIPFPITVGEGYFIRNYGSAGTFTLP